jgi:hypothetical protein
MKKVGILTFSIHHPMKGMLTQPQMTMADLVESAQGRTAKG